MAYFILQIYNLISYTFYIYSFNKSLFIHLFI